MGYVEARRNESFESLMKRFRKTVQEERILATVRRRRFYEKPSVDRKRRAARKLAKSRKTTRKDLARKY